MTGRATRDTALTLRELLAFDEGGILRLLLAPSGQDVAITGMIIGEEGAARSYAGRIVLAVGVLPSVNDFIREAAERGAVAVVLRDDPSLDAGFDPGRAARPGPSLDPLPEEVSAAAGAPAVAERAGIALLARAAWADWDDVATLVRSAAAYAGAGRGDRMADVTAGGGLAALASAVAEFTGGSITIEDTAFRVLAYSAIGPEADELRRSTILGGRVPDWRVEELRRSGLLRTLWSSDEVIHRPADGSSPERLIIAIRSGREMLGSIWAAADAGGPFTEGAARALRRAAEVAVPYLVQHRLRESGARRREEHALRALLAGRGDMTTHAWTLGLAPDLPCAVVIAELAGPAAPHDPGSFKSPGSPGSGGRGPGDPGEPVDPGLAALPAALPGDSAAGSSAAVAGQQREAVVERTMGLLAVQATSYRPGIRVLRDGGRVTALVPVRRGAERDVLALARELDTLAASLGSAAQGAGPVWVGAGPVVPSPLRAADSRADAELVVRVLRERRGARRHASAAELGVALDVQRVLDAVRPVWERGSGPVYDLVRADLAAGGELVRSLAAYLDASCDVGRAAERLVLHPNTLRYRLRRVRDRYGVDLDDPDTRLMLTLAVRLATRPR
ncbi:PucR family transcriptional regulator [Nonomuraea coxensis]|nr:helix-turn-helix domain-containing protein [Nonomuraea coxensis]